MNREKCFSLALYLKRGRVSVIAKGLKGRLTYTRSIVPRLNALSQTFYDNKTRKRSIADLRNPNKIQQKAASTLQLLSKK